MLLCQITDILLMQLASYAFGEGNDAARRLAKFVQKQALAGKELQQIIKGQMRRFETA